MVRWGKNLTGNAPQCVVDPLLLLIKRNAASVKRGMLQHFSRRTENVLFTCLIIIYMGVCKIFFSHQHNNTWLPPFISQFAFVIVCVLSPLLSPYFFCLVAGTSAAAPNAAAVALLLRELDSSLTSMDIYNIMETTAIGMGGGTTTTSRGGFDFDSGYGLIDALAAIEHVIGYNTTMPSPPMGNLAVTTTIPSSSSNPSSYPSSNPSSSYPSLFPTRKSLDDDDDDNNNNNNNNTGTTTTTYCSGACVDNACGNCKVARTHRGCSCPSCECKVCNVFPLCCSIRWSPVCVRLVESQCQCGAGTTPTTSSMMTSLTTNRTHVVQVGSKTTTHGHNLPTTTDTLSSGDSSTTKVSILNPQHNSTTTTTTSFMLSNARMQECLEMEKQQEQTPRVSSSSSSSSTTTTCLDGRCGNCHQETQSQEQGCNCRACQCAVCDLMSSCCVTEWSPACVATALQVCNC